MPSNTKENGFETLIVKWLVNENGYEQGTNEDYNKDYAIDETRLFRYLEATQAQEMAELRILDTPAEKKKFLDRLGRKLSDQGVLRYLEKASSTKTRRWNFIRCFRARAIRMPKGCIRKISSASRGSSSIPRSTGVLRSISVFS